MGSWILYLILLSDMPFPPFSWGLRAGSPWRYSCSELTDALLPIGCWMLLEFCHVWLWSGEPRSSVLWPGRTSVSATISSYLTIWVTKQKTSNLFFSFSPALIILLSPYHLPWVFIRTVAAVRHSLRLRSPQEQLWWSNQWDNTV